MSIIQNTPKTTKVLSGALFVAIMTIFALISGSSGPQTTKSKVAGSSVDVDSGKAVAAETAKVESEKLAAEKKALDAAEAERLRLVEVARQAEAARVVEAKRQADAVAESQRLAESSRAVEAQRIAAANVAAQQSNCDPNYSPCIKYVSGNGLNCPDIGVRVQVIGVDHNRFDGDGDGWGCEKYR
jgi:hypothetical protein